METVNLKKLLIELNQRSLLINSCEKKKYIYHVIKSWDITGPSIYPE